MHGSDDLLTRTVMMLMAVILIGVVIKRLNQPYFIAYIIAGVLLGPCCFGMVRETGSISTIGELGLLLQMFFLGTKKEVKTVITNIRKSLYGVLAQLVLSFIFVWMLGTVQSWDMKEIVLFTFILSVSSSAIIHEYLEKSGELEKPLGHITSGILVLQDFLLAPMLLVINFMSTDDLPLAKIIWLIAGTILISIFLKKVFLSKHFHFRFPKYLGSEHEAQLFTGLCVCFGFAWISQMAGLSGAIGAMLGGILVSKSDSLQWFESNLIPFRIFFISLFFVSVGLQINFNFLMDNFSVIISSIAIVMIVNSLRNGVAFKLLKTEWRDSIYAGALLSQIGEFSLMFCLLARQQKLVGEYWYQLTLAVIAGTMLTSTIWINIIRSFIYIEPSHVRLYSHKIRKALKR